MAELGTPIIGDPRYFNIENWDAPGSMGEGLHLHARRIALPLRNGRRLDVSAPLPAHMLTSFEALGFDPNRYDVQSTDPEDR
jgi:23S rRNA pseudouridine955/2504/2580 synthase